MECRDEIMEEITNPLNMLCKSTFDNFHPGFAVVF